MQLLVERKGKRKEREWMRTLAEGDGAPPALVSAVPHSRPTAQCETLVTEGLGQGQHKVERLKMIRW